MSKANIYIDVDGVLLTRSGELAVGANELLLLLLSNKSYTCHWLTTRCKGDSSPVMNVLQPLLESNVATLINQIQPTDWTTTKTEAIDFDAPFLWLDDSPLVYEINQLRSLDLINSWIKIDLGAQPDQLVDIAASLN